jgi:serine/threonine-protein kinase RsbT
MATLQTEKLMVRTSDDIVNVRQTVRKIAIDTGFNLVDQTKIITAASELARNTIIHGGGGILNIQIITNGNRSGVKLIFEDEGPGIADIELALKDGYTSGQGLGMGLGGARRLSNEFEIQSELGKGTRVAITKWK